MKQIYNQLGVCLLFSIFIQNIDGSEPARPGITQDLAQGKSYITHELANLPKCTKKNPENEQSEVVIPVSNTIFQDLPAEHTNASLCRSYSSFNVLKGCNEDPCYKPLLNFTAAVSLESLGESAPVIAVGQEQVIVALDGVLRSFNKQNGICDNIINIDPQNFFHSVAGDSPVKQPRIRYDTFSQRWVVVYITSGSPNRIVMAVSSQAVITLHTQWKFFYIEASFARSKYTNVAWQYPTLGVDEYALYIGSNKYANNGQFIDCALIVIPKYLLESDFPKFTIFEHLNQDPLHLIFSPHAVDNYDLHSGTGFFISMDARNTDVLIIHHIENPGQEPMLRVPEYVSISSVARPLPIQHKSTSNECNSFDSGDTRLYSAHIRNDRLWTVHNIGVNSMGTCKSASCTASRWYEIAVAHGTSPQLLQTGTLCYKTETRDQNISFWMPSLMTSKSGHMVISCNMAGPSDYPNAAYAYRCKDDPAGFLRGCYCYTPNTASYHVDNSKENRTKQRWSDYASICNDPTNENVMWTVGKWYQKPGCYAIQILKLEYTS